MKKLPPQGVLNYSDMFEQRFMEMYVDKHFQIEFIFTPIIFLSLVYGGYAVITLKDGKTITASNLDQIPKIGVMDLYEFKYLSRPAQISMAELKRLFDMIGLNPALLDNPNDRETGVAQLLSKAQELSNSAVMATNKLNNGFDLWGEPLVSTTDMNRLRDACNAVRNEFSNYSAKFNTPAKLNNFSLSMDEVDKLQEQIKLAMLIPQYMDFKSGCGDVVSYIQNIEYIDLEEEFKSEVEQAKGSFRTIRDSIMDGESGEAAAQKVDAALGKVKAKYIDIYFDAHKKKRLDITDAQRRGKIQEGKALANLRKLRSIEILSVAKLTDIETDISGLVVCYELTPEELKTTHICCPHCRFHLDDKAKNVYGQLDNIEIRIDSLLEEWTQTLLNTISDPIVSSQKTFLPEDQQKAIDSFIESVALPKQVDDFFVKAINALLKGFEPVVIDTDVLVAKLEQLPPMDEASFKAKISELVGSYTKGKDASKLRIVVKRKESEA